jgi:hypothetical protein
MLPPSHRQPAFVSEPIEPLAGSADVSAMSRGEPGLPSRYTWRGRLYLVTRVVSTWKTSTRDRGELYLRRHWFEIDTDAGERFKLYCERQARPGARAKSRWWVYTVEPAPVVADET